MDKSRLTMGVSRDQDVVLRPESACSDFVREFLLALQRVSDMNGCCEGRITHSVFALIRECRRGFLVYSDWQYLQTIDGNGRYQSPGYIY